MEVLISKQSAIKALIQKLYEKPEEYWDNGLNRYDIEETINALPPAQPERPKSKWIWKLDEGDPGRSMMLVCARCGGGRNKVGIYNFCNICGAEMINPEPINQW